MTRNGVTSNWRSGSARWALPLLFVLALGILFQGGDWPPATFLIRTALFLLAALLLLRFDTITLRPTAIDLLIVSFLAVEAASLARADYRWVSYQWFLHHSAAFILYLLLRAQPDPDGRFPAAAGRLILGVAAVEVLVALFQRFFMGALRPDGTLENPNLLAEVFLYGVIAAYYALGMRGSAGRRWLPPVVALFAGAIVLTGSRGVFLVSLAVAVYLLAGRFGWKRTIAGAAVAAVAFLLVTNTLLDRFLGRGDPYAFERLNMWKAALRIFADHPFGVGAGHFQYYWPAARDPVESSLIRFARHAATPHSEFFSVLSELGLPGAAAFLGLGAAGFLSLRRAARLGDPAVSGAVTILFASFLHAVVETNYHIIGFLLLNAAALSVVSGRLWMPVWEKTVRVGGGVRWACLALLAAMSAYSGMTLGGTLLESRGIAALRAGQFEGAALQFSRAAAVDPWRASSPDSGAAALYRLYESGGGGGYLSRAVESEMDATIRNPLDFRFHARLGFLYAEALDLFQESGRGTILRASLAADEKAIMLNPHSAEIRYQKALMLRKAGRVEESRRLIEEVLADEPRFARGWALMGEFLEAGDREKATAMYEKALDLYYTHGKRAAGPDEREFLSLDDKAVETRVRELRADRKR